nr:hypothetical protein [Tanacetum cinerariifolium]
AKKVPNVLGNVRIGEGYYPLDFGELGCGKEE